MPIDSAEKRPYYVLIETNNALEGRTMMAFYFLAWNRKKNWLMEDFRIEAASLEDAKKAVCEAHAADWIIGDCRHCRLI